MYDKIIKLIGQENVFKLNKAKILLVGCGGVGSFVFEALIRSGFQNITVIDSDVVEITNLNRQLIASQSTIGINKVDVAKKKAEAINNDINIQTLKIFLNENNINDLDKDFDYIIDACDTLKTKLALIQFAEQNNIKIISSMGMGNRLDASKIKITTLSQTKNDPLAKKLRKMVKDNNIKIKIPVVYSEEIPIKKGEVNSLITSPGIAGLLIVNYLILDIIKAC